MKVLLTDDSMTIRIIIRDLLNKLGYDDVTECRNGLEAWETLQKEHFDLILLDIHMPKMDGLTVLEKIRTEPSAGREFAPVVFITSDTDQRQIERAKELKAFGYVKKPFRKEGLERAIVAAEKAEKERKEEEKAAVPMAIPVATEQQKPEGVDRVPASDDAGSTAGRPAQEESLNRGKFSWMRSIMGK